MFGSTHPSLGSFDLDRSKDGVHGPDCQQTRKCEKAQRADVGVRGDVVETHKGTHDAAGIVKIDKPNRAQRRAAKKQAKEQR